MEELTIGSFLPVLTKVLEPLSKEALRSARDQWKKYTGNLDGYLQRTVLRHKYFSSVVFSNEGKLLEDYYIPLTLAHRHEYSLRAMSARKKKIGASVKIEGFPDDLLAAYSRILVVDTAGMGKSTLFKFLFLKTVQGAKSIPIFVELRRLSDGVNLTDLILRDISNEDGDNRIHFHRCLARGAFTFYFDGFDEVSDELKKTVSRDIVDLIERAPSCKFLISSREEPSLTSLGQFHRFFIQPLETEEAYSLIRRLIPQNDIANSLIDKISESSTEISVFLENPLLVSLLVKSFLHSPILPVHLSEFYRQVFDALYQTHDANKELGGFAREKKSALNLDRFHKCLRALGILTYQLGRLEYSRDEAVKEIDRAKELAGENGFSASDLLDDLLMSVPLFVQEGVRVRWSHRSLQEYFAASYICVDSKEDQKRILLSLCLDGASLHNANLLYLCADIDGKTFRESIIRNILGDIVQFHDTAYQPADFPHINSDSLAARRAAAFDVDLLLYVLHRNDFRGGQAVLDLEKVDPYISKNRPMIGAIPMDSELLHCEETAPEATYFCIRTGMKWGYAPLIALENYFKQGLWDLDNSPREHFSLKGLQPGVVYRVDADPENILNSEYNFAVITELLQQENHSLDSKLCRAYLNEIEESIKKSEALKIRF